MFNVSDNDIVASVHTLQENHTSAIDFSNFGIAEFSSFLFGKQCCNLTDFNNVSALLWKLRSKKTKSGFETFVDSLNMYLIPIIITVGLIGNIMSALVFTCTHLRRLSSSLYLTWLSLADVGFLLALGLAWLDRMGIHWLTVSGWCQSVVYLTRVCGCLSVWFVLSFTMERYIIVYHALRKDQLCTKQKAKVAIGVICVITLLLYTYIFFTYDVIALGPKKICAPLPEFHDMMTIMTSIDTVFACVVPSISILILNARIIHKIHQFQKHRLGKMGCPTMRSSPPDNIHIRRRSVLHASISTTGSMRIKFSNKQGLEEDLPTARMLTVVSPDKCQRLVRYRSQLRMARMLLIVSSMFVLLNLPSHVFRVQAFLHQLVWDNIKTPRVQYKVHEFFEIFFFLNFAINFFVYSMCGKQFRRGLVRLYRRVKYRLEKTAQFSAGALAGRRSNNGKNMEEKSGFHIIIKDLGL